MSGGFPNRPNRTAFGPTYVNARPTRNPTKNAPAYAANLAFFQTAGSGVVVPKAWLIGRIIGGPDVELDAHAESWNPNGETTGDYTPPTLTYSSTGVFTFEYPSQVPNDEGDLVALELSWGMPVAIAQPGGTTLAIGSCVMSSPVAGTIRMVSLNIPSTWALVDVDFALALW